MKKNKDKELEMLQEMSCFMCKLDPIRFLNNTVKEIDYDDDELIILNELTCCLQILGTVKETIYKSGNNEAIKYYEKLVVEMLENMKGLLTYE